MPRYHVPVRRLQCAAHLLLIALWAIVAVEALSPNPLATVVTSIDTGITALNRPLHITVDLRGKAVETPRQVWTAFFGDVFILGNGSTVVVCPDSGLFDFGGGSVLSIVGVVLTGCRNAPAISARHGAKVQMEDVTIRGCVAGTGAIHLTDGASLSATTCTLAENVAVDGGHVSMAGGARAEFSQCEFSRGSSVRGGIFSVSSFARVTATDCVFSDSRAAFGGAFFASDAGAVIVTGGSVARVSVDATHINAVSASFALVGASNSFNGLVAGVLEQEDAACASGGAVAALRGTASCVLTGLSVSFTLARETHGSVAVVCSSASLVVESGDYVHLDGRVGPNGADARAIVASGSGAYVKVSSAAVYDAVGGFIWARDGARVRLEHSLVQNSTSIGDGGIVLLTASASLEASSLTVLDCASTEGSGGFIAVVDSATPDAINVQIGLSMVVGSTATQNGGAFYVNTGGIVMVSGSTFINLSSMDGGFAHIGGMGRVIVTETAVSNVNVLGAGGIAHLDGASGFVSEACTFQRLSASIAAVTKVTAVATWKISSSSLQWIDISSTRDACAVCGFGASSVTMDNTTVSDVTAHQSALLRLVDGARATVTTVHVTGVVCDGISGDTASPADRSIGCLITAQIGAFVQLSAVHIQSAEVANLALVAIYRGAKCQMSEMTVRDVFAVDADASFAIVGPRSTIAIDGSSFARIDASSSRGFALATAVLSAAGGRLDVSETEFYEISGSASGPMVSGSQRSQVTLSSVLVARVQSMWSASLAVFVGEAVLTARVLQVSDAVSVASARGGVLYAAESAQISVSMATFDRVGVSANGSSGGVLAVYDSASVALSRSTIRQAFAAGSGAVLHSESTVEARVSDVMVTDATAPVGGCFSLSKSASLQLNLGELHGCHAVRRGGVVFALGGASSVHFNRVTITDAAGYVGGVVYLQGDPADAIAGTLRRYSVSLLDCDVRKATAKEGGVLYAGGSASIAIQRSSFADIAADGDGGVLSAKSYDADVTASVSDSVFEGISAGIQSSRGSGGLFSLQVAMAAVTVARCTIHDMSAATEGAILFASQTATVTIVNSTMSRINALHGGAVSMAWGVLVVDGCQFKTLITNGCFYLTVSVTATIRNTTMNTLQLSAAGSGLLFIDGISTADIQGMGVFNAVMFEGGDSTMGGLVHATGKSFVSLRGFVVRNIQWAGGGAGIAYIRGVATLDVQNADIAHVAASGDLASGGAFVVRDGGKLVVSDSVFFAVAASRDGGGMQLMHAAQATIHNVSFVDVKAGRDGGLVASMHGSRCTLKNVSAAGTHADSNGGFAHLSSVGSIVLADVSIGSASSGSHGGCFYLASQSPTLRINSSTAYACTAGEDPETYGSGGVLYFEANANAVVEIEGFVVASAAAMLGAIVFRDAPKIATPRFAELLVVNATARYAGSGNYTTSPDTLAAIPGNVTRTVRSGAVLPAFEVVVLDAYGAPSTISGIQQLSVVLVVRRGPCILAGGLIAYFTATPYVRFDSVSVFSNLSSIECILGFDSANFVYTSDSRLVTSFSMGVYVDECLAGFAIEKVDGGDSSTARYACVATPTVGSSGVVGGGSNTAMVVSVAVVVPVVCVSAVLAAVWVYVRRVKRKHSKRVHAEFVETQLSKRPELAALEVPRESVHLREQLGAGEFGVVYKAEVMFGARLRLCAAKTLRTDASIEDYENFVSEAHVMAPLRSQHVIGLAGLVLTTEPMMVLLEYAPHGDLRSFVGRFADMADISSQATAIERMFLSFCVQIGEGMAYLSSIGVIHRDLAARNVLVSQDAWGEYAAKIADFGLSKEIDVGRTDYYRKSKASKVPIRWLPPEALHRRVWKLQASDCWSFGVVMWEIYSLGKIPYGAGISNTDILEHILAGNRLPRPTPQCPASVYAIMHSCWASYPDDRPLFSTLVAQLRALESDFAAVDRSAVSDTAVSGVLGLGSCGDKLASVVVPPSSGTFHGASGPYDNATTGYVTLDGVTTRPDCNHKGCDTARECVLLSASGDCVPADATRPSKVRAAHHAPYDNVCVEFVSNVTHETAV